MDKARSGIGKKELLVSCLLPSLLLAGVTHAADIVWTNTAGGNFATAVNWNPNQVPASGDTAWITNDGTYTVTFNTSATIGSLMLGGSSGTQTFNHSSGTLTLSGSSVGSDHAIYNLSGGGLTGNGSFALTGILNWTAGIVGSSGATLALSANGGLAIGGINGKSFTGVTLVNNGSGTWNGGQISCSGGVFSNAPSATFDFQGDGSAFVLSSGTPLILNAGTMRKTAGTGTTTSTVRCNNTGSVQVNSGTLALTLADSSGSFSMSLGNTLSVNGNATLLPSATIDGVGNFAVTTGTLTNNGTFHVDGTNTLTSGSITFNGSCFITNGPLVINGGTATFNGTSLITPGSLSVSAGSLQGSMPVTVPGLISWTGGVIGTSSTLVLTANGGLAISGANAKNLTGGMIVNNGVATWSGGQVSCSGTAIFSNAPSATLDFQADGSAFIVSSGTPLVVNSGILRKSAGTGTTTLTVRCNNAGSVQVNSGTLAMVPADSNGSFSASAGNTLSLNGSATFSALASIDGGGNFIVTSGTFTNNGTFHIDGTNTFASGIMAFNGNTFITNNPMIINGGTVIFNGSGVVAPTLLNLSAGNLLGSMTVMVPGLITWTGGTIGNSGSSLTVVANGGLSIIGATPKTFNGGMVVNNGLAMWNGASVSWNGTPVFSNAPSATLDFQADGNAFILNSGTPVVLNSGLLKKSTGTGTTFVTVRCNNAGSAQVNSGTLALTVGDSSGSFAFPAGTALSVNGIAVLSPTASIDGAGNFTVTSGTITNNGSFHVDGTNTFTSGTITFNGSCFMTNNPMVINNGTVVFSGSGVVAPTLLNMSGGSVQGSMTVTVPGLMSWTGGLIGSSGSSLVVAANGGLAITGIVSKSFSGGTLVNNGPAIWTGATVACNNSAVFSNAPSGFFDLQADGTAFIINAGNPLVVNSGILRKSAGSGTTTVGVRCSNAGSVQVNSGNLALTLGDSTGAFSVAAGTTLSVNGTAVLSPTASIDGPGNFTLSSATITNNGSFHIDGVNTFTSGTIALNGSCFITNGPIVINGGTVVFNGSGIISPASLSFSAGGLLGNMTVAVSGLTAWSGATILGSAGSSLLVIANGGLIISNAQTKSFNGGVLVNNGAGTWSGGQITCINNAILSNTPAATFDLTDGTPFATFTGNPAIQNGGILRKSAGSGTTTVGIPCNNSGTVQANIGTLALTLGDSSGNFTVAAGNLLTVNGTATLSPSASISGAGNFAVSAGTITNNGLFHVDGTNTFNGGGTLALNGNCIVTNAPVILNGGTVVFNGTGTVAPPSLTLSSGSLLGSMTITVSGLITWTGSTTVGSAGSSLLVIANGGLTISGVAAKAFSGGTILNNATATWSTAQIVAINNAVFSNAPSALLDLQGDGIVFATFTGTPAVINAGTLRKSAGSGTTSINISCINFGSVEANTGTLALNTFTQSSGQTTLNGGAYNFANTAQLLGGTLQGSGTITGSVSNNAVISPGSSRGLISMTGNYSEGPNAHLVMELGGTTAGSGYDELSVGGKATLRGSLDVSFINGFVPGPGNVFTALVCNTRSGVFGTLNTPTNNLGAIYTSKTVLLETGNASPMAQLAVDPFQLACHTFLLSASGTDPDGSVTNLTLLLDTNVLASTAGGSVQTSFNSDFPGDLTFTVLATDNKGASGGTNVTVHLGTLPTLVLDAVGFQTNRAFKLCMAGETGTNYEVIANDDLTASNWVALGTMENTNGIWRFNDSAAANSEHRFYRAQQLP